MSEPSNRINSMNQHFLLQNIKVVNYRGIKNVTLPNILACAKPFASQLTGKKALCNFKWYFFYPKIGSIWRVNCSLQARIFDKVAFFLSFLWNIFIFWRQKCCWFIEFILQLGWHAVCVVIAVPSWILASCKAIFSWIWKLHVKQ